MLKISASEWFPLDRTLRLEGQIKGPWVDEVRDSCGRFLGGLILDLSQVTFVDEDGIRLLTELRSQGVHLESASPFVSHLLGMQGTPVSDRAHDMS